MSKISFALGIHNHQPVGNFDFVFTRAYRQSYKPFLETALEHPQIRFSLHTTGTLFEWLEKHERGYFDLVAKLLERQQLELLGGAFYEPILSVLPREDALEQLTRMRAYLLKRFGVTPRGAWLAERVWEPNLPAILTEGGVEYLPLDDDQFLAAGHELHELSGYFLTEANCGPVALFPIHKKLRYTIPFADPEASLDYMREMAVGVDQPLFVMADDGEKFGLWPKTHEHVYKNRWLHRFFEMLEQHADEVELLTLGEARDRIAPAGRTYLPTGSYSELSEWSLPPHAQREFQALVHESEQRPDWNDIRPFLKGGYWRGFMSRYGEANNLHKKMLRVSRKYHHLSVRKRHGDVYAPLLRGQCNCAYWHGVFGGLYLPHLRHAAWKELLASEYAMDNASHRGRKWVDIEKTDFDADGHDEILMENAFANAYLAPAHGGTLFEWDYRPRGYNLLDTLTRHEEAYHSKLQRAVLAAEESETGDVYAADGDAAPETHGTENGTASIHDLVLTKEAGLDRVLSYDRWPRVALLDHFPGWNSTIAEFQNGRMADYGDFLQGPYTLSELFTDAAALQRRGNVGGTPVELTKTIRLVPGRSSLQIHYRLRNLAAFDLHTPFGIEWNLALMAADSNKHTLSLPELELLRRPLREVADNAGIRQVQLVDEDESVGVRFQFEEPTRLWRVPIESVSLSEGGFERVFQSVALLFRWDLHLTPGAEWNMAFTATLAEG